MRQDNPVPLVGVQLKLWNLIFYHHYLVLGVMQMHTGISRNQAIQLLVDHNKANNSFWVSSEFACATNSGDNGGLSAHSVLNADCALALKLFTAGAYTYVQQQLHKRKEQRAVGRNSLVAWSNEAPAAKVTKGDKKAARATKTGEDGGDEDDD